MRPRLPGIRDLIPRAVGAGRASAGNEARVVPGVEVGVAGLAPAARPTADSSSPAGLGSGLRSSAWWWWWGGGGVVGGDPRVSEVGVDTNGDTLPPGSHSGGPLRCSCDPCRALLNILECLSLLKKTSDFMSKPPFLLASAGGAAGAERQLLRWPGTGPQAPPGSSVCPLPSPVAARVPLCPH